MAASLNPVDLSTDNCCPCFSPLLFSLVSALSRDVTVLCHFRTAVGLLWAPASPPRANPRALRRGREMHMDTCDAWVIPNLKKPLELWI